MKALLPSDIFMSIVFLNAQLDRQKLVSAVPDFAELNVVDPSVISASEPRQLKWTCHAITDVTTDDNLHTCWTLVGHRWAYWDLMLITDSQWDHLQLFPIRDEHRLINNAHPLADLDESRVKDNV